MTATAVTRSTKATARQAGSQIIHTVTCIEDGVEEQGEIGRREWTAQNGTRSSRRVYSFAFGKWHRTDNGGRDFWVARWSDSDQRRSGETRVAVEAG
jgi:hypothetical protein